MFRRIVLLTIFLTVSTEDIIVDTQWGQVTGHTVDLSDGTKINSFLSIPFAKPPTGNLRFMPPENPDRWENYVADSLGPVCPQGSAGVLLLTHPLWDSFDENCLHLNLYAPNTTSSSEGYPVMVWFHGGGYTSSGNIQYPGHFLASKGVIVVVPNYRLGHLGFMSTGDSTVPGNMGLLDQRKALEFIRDNVANFGGNPNKVTLFGQSAGASSAALHMLMPESRSLFHQIIQESGVAISPWGYNEEFQEPEKYTEEVARKLNCTRPTTAEMMDCLRDVDAETLRTTPFDCKAGTLCQGFAPVVDGTILPRDPLQMREEEDYKKCPILSGQTTEDGSLYTIALVPDAVEGPLNITTFNENIDRLTSYFAQTFPNRKDDAIAIQRFYYSNWDDLNDGEANRQKINEMITDFAWGWCGDLQAKQQSEHDDVYMYLFGFRSKQADDIVPPWMGVPHNGELPYVFGYPLLERNPNVRQDQEMFFDFIPWDNLDVEFSEYVQTLWTNFAKTGNPTPTPVKPPGDQPETNWQKFTKTNKNYLYITDNDVNMKVNYRQKSHAYFRELLQYLINSEPGKKINAKPWAKSMTSDTIEKAYSKLGRKFMRG
ncbi:DgyrCDS791 [Dimorphilus gyrociliatus]|uniref:Carboxylic ester hydrolase n=1 Tax=Dimorphilus gyrociliatus TaxID=2664684 RepID=A0A7I8V5E0_9ANNE|nr:DgyrCDS791 [Dimorphilus gyrociliatus]